ncbi:uncharacterized protein K452DRAFT_295032 [Aplosporella prunicola CBS 121167]|uniref:DUF4470 domain-containing protein n=1 Tax=Aplosporella prunicola CBS 121167 TaxID=1176127 RepID=A0A6A6BPJ9_9PEZI|nr:uncharacterized protein K452DRAFT_295032 [Aplosporella prunicola CBS 121167]KAF2145383.1 hypothetical protein K452DRAFT_295032 [Aplosporella prunicola CBS 121167]
MSIGNSDGAGRPMSSAELRQQGNAFYKRNKFYDAIALYRKAAEADPSDVSPLSNITAAYYEAGDYAKCIKAVEDALVAAGGKAKEDKEIKLLEPWSRDHQESEATAIRKIINKLPRFKPSLDDVTEYFTVGTDIQQSLLETTDISCPLTSFLFAGIGDARHMHATLVDIANQERQSGKASQTRYHFTIVDWKPAVIARNIIVFLLLEELTDKSITSCKEKKEEILATLFYVYIGVIMPPKAYEKLQRTISAAISFLNAPDGSLQWIQVPEKDKASIRGSFQRWQQEVAPVYTTKRMREQVYVHLEEQASEGEGLLSQVKPPPSCKKDCTMFAAAAVLIPPKSFLEEDSLGLSTILTKKSPERAMRGAWLQKLDNNWMPNVTLIDLEWPPPPPPPRENDYFWVGHEPVRDFGFGSLKCYPANPKCMYDYAADYFMRLGDALDHVKSRVRVEAIVGDMAETCEKIRYGLLEHRQSIKHAEETCANGNHSFSPEEYPQLYDRIHMSNIPDYIRGTLSSFLFAAPVTKPSDRCAYFRSNCLLNRQQFAGPSHFDKFNNE